MLRALFKNGVFTKRWLKVWYHIHGMVDLNFFFEQGWLNGLQIIHIEDIVNAQLRWKFVSVRIVTNTFQNLIGTVPQWVQFVVLPFKPVLI